MSFITVPWAVEQGAENSPETARILAYAATSSNSGVIGAPDFRVAQTPTPGAGVAVGTGAIVAACATPGYPYQSYIASRPVDDDYLPVPPNSGNGTRYDMVIVRIENPWIESSLPAPDTVQQGPYVQLRLLDNVGQAAVGTKAAARSYLRSLGITGVPLAGLAVPAGANTIVNAYIVDLRTVANPRTSRPGPFPMNPSTRYDIPGSWGPWLASLGWRVDVPEWATHVALSVTVFGAKIDKQSGSTNGTTNGQIRISMGSNVLTQAANYDLDALSNSGATRTVVGCADKVAVPAAMRGTLQTIVVQGDQIGGNQPLYADSASSAILDVVFYELIP